MPLMTPLMKPPGGASIGTIGSAGCPDRKYRYPEEWQGPQNQRSVIVRHNYGGFSTQLQCKRCQTAVVSHSRDGYSVNAKSLIANSYSASYYPQIASISSGPLWKSRWQFRTLAKPLILLSQRPAAYKPWTQGWRCGLGAAHRVVLSVACRPPLFPSFFGFRVLVTINLYDSL